MLLHVSDCPFRVWLIIPPAASRPGQAAREQLDVGDEEPNLRALEGGFEVLGEAAIAVELGDGAHDDPSTGKGSKPLAVSERRTILKVRVPSLASACWSLPPA